MLDCYCRLTVLVINQYNVTLLSQFQQLAHYQMFSKKCVVNITDIRNSAAISDDREFHVALTVIMNSGIKPLIYT